MSDNFIDDLLGTTEPETTEPETPTEPSNLVNSEVENLKAQMAAIQAEAAEARREAEELRRAQQQTNTSQEPAISFSPNNPRVDLADADIDVLDRAQTSLVTKIATQVVEQALAPVVDKLNEVLTRVQGDVVNTNQAVANNARQVFVASVTAAVSDAAEIYQSPEFAKFRQLQPIYNDAFETGDASNDSMKVIQVLKAFKEHKRRIAANTTNNLNRQTMPSMTSSEGPTGVNGSMRPKISRDDFNKASIMAAQGKISKEKFNEISAAFIRQSTGQM